MKRRTFLQALLGLFAAPAAAALPAPASERGPGFWLGADSSAEARFSIGPAGADATAIGLFRGEIGRWDAMRIAVDNTDLQWTEAELAELEAGRPVLVINRVLPLFDELIAKGRAPWAS